MLYLCNAIKTTEYGKRYIIGNQRSSCIRSSYAMTSDSLIHFDRRAPAPPTAARYTAPLSLIACMLTGKPLYTVTEGSINFMGKDLLAMSPEERSWAGIFMSFQYPIEIPGVTITNFMKTAVNAKRKAEGLDPMKAGDFLKLMREKMAFVQMRPEFAKREVNVGFSGGEKKRNEIFQMAMLDPTLSILDETDSGLDVDALRIVAEGVRSLHTPEKSAIVITHYKRLLDYIVPDIVHVLKDGKIVATAGRELVDEIEEKGYDIF